MAASQPDIWYRYYDTPYQLAALVQARGKFSGPADFARAFWSSVEAEINDAHEVEAGFTTVQNYGAEVARWAAVGAGWRTPNASGRVPFSTRKDYEALRDHGVISVNLFGHTWSLQIERNHLTHERPLADPLKVWAASLQVARVVPSLLLDVQTWAPSVGLTI